MYSFYYDFCGVKDTFFSKKKLLNIRGELISLESPIVMGIVNVTPDSFFDGGKYVDEEAVLERVSQVISEGGLIVDVGGYSSRPGAAEISEEEELKRVIPAIKIIRNNFPNVIISADTFRSNVAYKAIEKGADIINDISVGSIDKRMFDVVAELNVPYIMMHMQGTPQTMQLHPEYKDVTQDIIYYFSEKIDTLYQKGVSDIILDPGFGFGKTVEHNYTLLKNLQAFNMFELPVLVGLSRKSMINKVLNISPKDALNGTTVINTLALLNGADILRVHDVKQAVEAVKLVEYYKNNS
jgi:dihydropteroate synthase